MSILEIVVGIPLALAAIFVLFRIISTAIFISWWKAKYWALKEYIKQSEEERKEEKKNGD